MFFTIFFFANLDSNKKVANETVIEQKGMLILYSLFFKKKKLNTMIHKVLPVSKLNSLFDLPSPPIGT